jgi:hypothetical protein
MLIDELARRQGARVDRLQHGAAVGRAQLEGRRALLAKPLTFMNASGEAVGKLARYYKVNCCAGSQLFFTPSPGLPERPSLEVYGLRLDAFDDDKDMLSTQPWRCRHLLQL